MKEYQKIETVFNRSLDGNHKLLEGDYRNPIVEMLADCNWRIYEKIDGTNIRVHWDGYKVEFGGRTDKAEIPGALLNLLKEHFGTPEAEEVFEQQFGDKDVIIFGEGYGKKIQNGDGYCPDGGVNFAVFDVMVNGYYLDNDAIDQIAWTFGFNQVPYVGMMTLEEAVFLIKEGGASYLEIRKNYFGDNAPFEGFVARPEYGVYDKQGHRIIVKIKVKDFKEG